MSTVVSGWVNADSEVALGATTARDAPAPPCLGAASTHKRIGCRANCDRPGRRNPHAAARIMTIQTRPTASVAASDALP